ncbi:MAG: DUF4339 domain-containing protein [Opitutus sp.]|nr:DUF4339 domain-containing protein [Opitutus sp.]
MMPLRVLFVRVGEEIRGPYHLEQLRQLAEVEVLTPRTLASESAAGPWTPLSTMAENPTLFPPRPELNFKPTNFVSLNEKSAPLPDAREVIAFAHSAPLPASAREIVVAKKSEAPNEVLAMVREVEHQQAQFAPPPPPPPKWRPSRRLQLCVVLAVAGNATLAAIAVGYGALHDELSMMILSAWAVLYNGGVAVLFVTLPRE